VEKYPLEKKFFGIFDYRRDTKNDPLLRGFDDTVPCPQSRHTTVRKSDIEKISRLTILSESADGDDVLLVKSNSGREVFMTGHLEYDTTTLGEEYRRDKNRGLEIETPRKYFPNDDPAREPLSVWRSTAHLFFSNWLNYYVYQETPYEFA
jgi:homoserine O-succinyltransferase